MNANGSSDALHGARATSYLRTAITPLHRGRQLAYCGGSKRDIFCSFFYLPLGGGAGLHNPFLGPVYLLSLPVIKALICLLYSSVYMSFDCIELLIKITGKC